MAVASPTSWWNDSASRQAIEAFVKRVTSQGSADFVEPASRVAVFDNDGTLWCEKPMPIELGLARARGWTVVSMKNDWKSVFAGTEG